MMIRTLALAGLAVAGLCACSSMDNAAPSATRASSAASETSPGTGSVAPAVTGVNSSTVTPQSKAGKPAPEDTPH
jgi:ABC-type phosphate transport system substrate-binding protein